MRGPHNIWRLIRTGATFERTGAMRQVMDALDAPRAFRIFARTLVWPIQWLGIKGDESLPPITRAITALGPAYIKFGQILSTRPDVVGHEMALQLRVLQDKLPPFPQEEAIERLQSELGQPLDEVFSEFSEAVAAASIAQVHKAKRKSDGHDVAVKILRPGITKAFRKDIDAFYFAAWVIEALSSSARRLKPSDVIEHFDSVVRGELDLRLEAASASEFRENTQDDKGFEVPRVDWELSTRKVMTLDWVEGLPASGIEDVIAAGHDPSKIGQTILQMFLNHALRDGYFHADMHHGNLKIAPNGDIQALDFGIMGALDAYTRRVYAEILYGFIERDYKRVAEVHFEAGYVPADQDVDEFARALRAVGEPIFGMNASKISMARLLTYLFEVTERFGMQTRTELILLQRTMVVVEGVARSFDPKLNIWEVAHPVVEDYIKSHLGPRALAKDIGKTALVFARLGPKLPKIAEDLIAYQSKNNTKSHPANSYFHTKSFAMGSAITAVAAALIASLH